MAKFKKFLRLVSFVLIFCLLLSGASWIFAPKDNRKEAGFRNSTASGYLGEKENTIDVLFLGDSECYSSFSPMQLWNEHGLVSYSCGTSRQYIQDTQQYLHSFCEKQNPKLVILEVNLMYRSEGKMTDFMRGFQNTLMQILPIVEYHDRWKNLTFNDSKKSSGYTGRDTLKGFRINKKIKPYVKGEYMRYTDASHEIPSVNLYYFKKIAEYCKQNNIQLLLVNTASPVNWTYEKHNGIAELAKEYDLKYLDMNLLVKELKINWEEDTYDEGDHVNFNGAEKVTKYLGKYIKENYELPDRRADKNYEIWHKDFKAYNEKVKNG